MRLPVRRRLWQQVFDLVQRQTTMDEFHGSALYDRVRRIRYVREDWQLVPSSAHLANQVACTANFGVA
jgi:hypothetical protein